MAFGLQGRRGQYEDESGDESLSDSDEEAEERRDRRARPSQRPARSEEEDDEQPSDDSEDDRHRRRDRGPGLDDRFLPGEEVGLSNGAHQMVSMHCLQTCEMHTGWSWDQRPGVDACFLPGEEVGLSNVLHACLRHAFMMVPRTSSQDWMTASCQGNRWIFHMLSMHCLLNLRHEFTMIPRTSA